MNIQIVDEPMEHCYRAVGARHTADDGTITEHLEPVDFRDYQNPGIVSHFKKDALLHVEKMVEARV